MYLFNMWCDEARCEVEILSPPQVYYKTTCSVLFHLHQQEFYMLFVVVLFVVMEHPQNKLFPVIIYILGGINRCFITSLSFPSLI